MLSFLAGAAAVDGAESGRWGEALLGGALMGGGGSNSSWTSAVGGGLFADGVRHHNVGEEIAGLTLGVLGAASSSSNTGSSYNSSSYRSSSYEPPSYHHYHHHHHETEEERDNRIEREHRALLAEEKRKEERRRAREERDQRDRQERIAATNRENENQAARYAIHLKHHHLITSAKKLDYDSLKKEIQNTLPLPQESPSYRYIQTSHMGFPESKSENIYSAILSNRLLSSDNKSDLIHQLRTKDYYKHEAHLVKRPALALLLTEKSPAMVTQLISSYNRYLSSCDGKNLENERDVWKNIRDIHPGQITDTLRNVIRYSHNHQKPMQFAIDWLNSINSSTEILAAHREIDKIFKAFRHIDLTDPADTIFKFAKQRILTLEKNSEVKEGTPTTSDYDQGRVELFLNRHRGWHLCCQRTKSKEIYDGLRNKSRGAQALFDEENVKIENTLTSLHLFGK